MNNLEESLMGEYTMRENMSGVSFADPFAPKTEQTLTPTEMTSGIDAQLALVSARTLTQLVWRGGEARDHMRAVWQHDGALLSIVYPLLSDVHNEMHATRSLCIDRTIASDNNCPLDAFFIDVLAVAPPRFRPLKVMGEALVKNDCRIFRARMQTINNTNTHVLLHYEWSWKTRRQCAPVRSLSRVAWLRTR
jgi:hypothetical protein